ncbi:glutamate 5-kinase [Rapidithrix thailandica]|uniref:Glutamate 5-kinase n=1 Tax=Rapidithrix thailandica TaxID=413964 RepID=A0AAW9S672_9BACT
MKKTYQRIAVKIGSNVLTTAEGLPNTDLMAQLVQQVSQLIHRHKVEVILISSGAVAAGRSLIQLNTKENTVTQRQLLASIGQVKLIQVYGELFKKHRQTCSQILVTKEDFRDRQHYLNMQNCFQGLLKYGIIPIVNENDVVSVTELMFTDNDELAGLVASMMDVDALFILTNVNGLYNGHPEEEHTELIRLVDKQKINLNEIISTKKSGFGRGGMLTKCKNAQKIADLGIAVHIANGHQENVLIDLYQKATSAEELPGTLFLPHPKRPSSIKKWVAHSEGYAKASLIVNEGAKQALLSDKVTSLLPVGLTEVQGSFQKGDIVKIKDAEGSDIGIGMTKYNDTVTRERIGQQGHHPVIHYDHIFLY